MKVEDFLPIVTMQNTTVCVNCSRFTPVDATHPQVHTWYKFDDNVLIMNIYYLMPNEIFWFGLTSAERQKEANTIAEAIASRYNIQVETN